MKHSRWMTWTGVVAMFLLLVGADGLAQSVNTVLKWYRGGVFVASTTTGNVGMIASWDGGAVAKGRVSVDLTNTSASRAYCCFCGPAGICGPMGGGDGGLFCLNGGGDGGIAHFVLEPASGAAQKGGSITFNDVASDFACATATGSANILWNEYVKP